MSYGQLIQNYIDESYKYPPNLADPCLSCGTVIMPNPCDPCWKNPFLPPPQPSGATCPPMHMKVGYPRVDSPTGFRARNDPSFIPQSSPLFRTGTGPLDPSVLAQQHSSFPPGQSCRSCNSGPFSGPFSGPHGPPPCPPFPPCGPCGPCGTTKPRKHRSKRSNKSKSKSRRCRKQKQRKLRIHDGASDCNSVNISVCPPPSMPVFVPPCCAPQPSNPCQMPWIQGWPWITRTWGGGYC